MDKGAQEEVAPVYSYEEKLKTCRVFIKSKSHFTDYGPLLRVIEQGYVQPLHNIRDFRTNEYGVYSYHQQDAKEYFDWLVGIVAGLEKVPVAGVFSEAVEQLFTFLYHMRLYTATDKDPFATPSIEAELATFRYELAGLDKRMKARDDKITTILERIFAWMEQHSETLEEARKDYAKKAGRLSGVPSKP